MFVILVTFITSYIAEVVGSQKEKHSIPISFIPPFLFTFFVAFPFDNIFYSVGLCLWISSLSWFCYLLNKRAHAQMTGETMLITAM